MENLGRPLTKEQLVNRIWRESYNPPVHDPRVYMALMRIRKLFSRGNSDLEFISSTHLGYELKIQGSWAWIKANKDKFLFNEKQAWILSYLDNNTSICRKQIEKSLGIGPSAAKQEIRQLLDRGLLTKMGAARSTIYSKKRPNEIFSSTET